jgi:GNAT superfamily N-acetyltransferase
MANPLSRAARIEAVDDGALELAATLHERLYEFNVQRTGLADGRWLTFRAQVEGQLAGGLHGWTWGGSAWVDVLWVAAAHRGGGLGSALLGAAEAEAAGRGCAQIALSTYTFQARPFYQRHGYETLGFLSDHPEGYGQYTMRKRLAGDGAAER